MNRCLILVPWLFVHSLVLGAEPIEIGSRRELFVDDSLVEREIAQCDFNAVALTFGVELFIG